MNGIFDNSDFYPTPQNIAFRMVSQFNLNGKTILEPSAGKGDLLNAIAEQGAKILYCETSPPLQRILEGKGRFLCSDFLELKSEQISHIDGIIMNPPFSDAVKHILHAYEIAPAGAHIVSLINSDNLKNDYSKDRKQLKHIIETTAGIVEELGECFDEAERRTRVKVAMIVMRKAGGENQEFEGFFMEDEHEKNGDVEGVMSYNVVRNIVNRYVEACKIYGELLTVKSRLNSVTGQFFSGDIGVSVNLNLQDYKKALQRSGWDYIFNELDLKADMTRGVKETLNKFIEQHQAVPFTMRNIYRMLEIVIATRGQTMNKAIEEAFDRITEKHHDNRHHIKGWKTNLHYLVGKKFILPHQISPAKEYGYTSSCYTSLRSAYDGTVPDLEKALCFVMGTPYQTKTVVDGREKTLTIQTVSDTINRNIYGEWYNSHFFKYKGYKNGNMHFEFIDTKVWEAFNKRVAEIKGYPLFEHKEQTAYQQRNAGRKETTKETAGKILFTVKVKAA